MVRLIIGAVAAAAALAAAALVGSETGASPLLVTISAIASAIVVPLGGYGTLKYVFDRLPLGVRAQVSVVVTTAMAALGAYVATVPNIATFPRAALIVLTAVAGGAGIWTRATSTADPRDDAGNPLVPVGQTDAGVPRRPAIGGVGAGQEFPWS